MDETCLWWKLKAAVTTTAGSRIKVRYDDFNARWCKCVDLRSTRTAPHLSKATGECFKSYKTHFTPCDNGTMAFYKQTTGQNRLPVL